VRTVPLLTSSRDSYAREVRPVTARTVAEPAVASAADEARGLPIIGPRVLGIAAEGRLDGGAEPLRAIVIGDGDFASNSFFPYMSNSDFLLAAVRWLAREERAATVAARIPVPALIALTGEQQRAVFAMVVVALPLIVVVLGCVVWWRRR
jgi:hypothetical protein